MVNISMMLKVVTAPNPILSKRSEEIAEVNDDIRQFMDDMVETMRASDGVGLAAVQVGILKRILVLDLQNDDSNDRPKGFYPLCMANPKIIQKSEEMVVAMEGCLSLPEQRIEVARPKKIKVEYLDYNNQKQVLEDDDWLARVIQHEMDHLDGRLLIDYLSNLKHDIALRKLTKIQKLSA